MKQVLQYLEKSASLYPEKIAVILEEEKLTYTQLLNGAKAVGSSLADKASICEPVVVFGHKGIDTLQTFFGILYAGGCYSLVNPEFPDNRINQIVDVLQAKTVVTTKEYGQKANELFAGKQIFFMEDLLKGEINQEVLDVIRRKKLDIDPVYINFTSGSTGVPKGVAVCNRSVIDFIDEFTETFNINENDIIANQAPFDFDVSVKDIYSAMKVGATLVLIPMKFFSAPAALLDYLCDNKVTTMIWAVSALCLITTFHGLDYKVPETVNKIMYSGEVMPLKHLRRWMDKLPNVMYVNLYGPTEITCNCTYYIIDNNKTYEDAIPIGKAFNNERVFLLDEENKLVEEVGVAGEVCVSGTCLALGYYNNHQQTDSHFVQNPLNDKFIELIYRTGDLAKYDENGDLVFAGRKDFQIKYQGHRIELEEIDREISKINGVTRVVTIFYEKKSRLYAFYVGDITKEEIVEQLSKQVPSYMIPSNFKQLDEFKLNKNGKIDRKVLMEMIEVKK